MFTSAFNYIKIFTSAAIAFSLALVIFLSISVKNQAFGAAGINRQINFQGKLVNNPNGTNVSNTSYTVVFTIYDRDSSGTALWTETQTVTTADGIFRVSLGSQTPFPANFNFNWSGLYLGMKVNSDSEMTPRIQLAAVPFAFNAEKVSGLTVQDDSGNASTSGTLQVANAKIVTFKGANGLTFNDSNAGGTTISLPTVASLTLVGEATSQILTNKTIGSTGLTFSGATTDITTATNEDFIISPNGSGKVGINTTTLLSSIDLRGNPVTGGTLSIASVSGTTSFAGLIVDNSGLGDLFTASKSGLSLFTVKNNGQLKLGAPAYQTCSLTTDSTGLVTCGVVSSGTNWWNVIGGLITPVNPLNDFAIGGTVANGIATTSAKFSFTGVQTGVTVASISGQLVLMPNNGYGGNASISGQLVLGAFSNANIQTTNNQALTLGGNTTGNIILSPLAGVAGSFVAPSITNQVDLGSPALQWKNIYANGVILPTTANIDGFWQKYNGVVSPAISSYDFLLGSTSTTSSIFAFSGLTGSMTQASFSGQFALMPNNGYGGNATMAGQLTIGALNNATIQSVKNQLLTLGGNTTGSIQFNPNNTATLTLAPNLASFVGTNPIITATGANTLNLNSNSTGNIQFFGSATNYVSNTGNLYLSGTTGVTLSGNAAGITFTGNGISQITTAANQHLSLNAGSFGLVGINTDGVAPLANFDVRANIGTLAIASVSGTTSFASMVVDQSGVGDIFTASSSGAPRFIITRGGTVNLVGGQGTDLDTIAGTTLKIGAANATTISLGRSGQGVTLPGFTTAGSVLTVNGSGNLTPTLAGTALQCLVSQGAGTPIWTGCITGTTNFWTLDSSKGTMYPVNTTLDLLWGGTSTAAARFRLIGDSMSGTSAVASISAKTSYAALVVDNTIGDLITASANGTTKFVVRNDGSVSVGGIRDNSGGYEFDVIGATRMGNNALGDDVVKQTTSDFTQGTKCNTSADYCVTQSNSVDNVATANNQINLITDMIGAGATPAIPVSGPGIGQAVAGPSLSFQRPDGDFVLLNGSGTRTYDTGANIFGGGIAFTAGTVGNGLAAFQRPDGNFVVIQGGGTGTQIYSPGGTTNQTGTFTLGPVTTAAVGVGSVIIRRTDGKVLVVHGGGAGTTSVYDPTAAAGTATIGSFIVGPTIAAGGTVTTGSFQFGLPNGKFIVGLGGITTNIYDPSATWGIGGGGSFVAGPNLSAASGAGAHAIQLPDGRIMVILGGTTGATSIYDPNTNAFTAGPSLASAGTVGAGGHSFQRSDGKWVVVRGGGSTALQLYDPVAGVNGTFSTLANALTGAGAGAGAHTFQRQDGMYVVINGNSQTTSTLYDAGWNTTGTWTSEDISSNKISTYSAMVWSSNPQSANNNARLEKDTIAFYVKTAATQGGLATASWVRLIDSDLLIKAVAGAAWAKIQVNFTAPVRSYQQASSLGIYQRNIWAGEGEVFYRRSFLQPTVFSIRIENPLVQYGDSSGDGDPAYGRNFEATSGAQLEGVYTDNTNWLQLSVNRNLPTATPAAGLIIASASANLGATAGAGTHTIERSNGQFLIIIGGTTTTRVYDPDTNTFSAGPTLPNTAGAGAHSFLMPNGMFFVVLGNGANNTAIFDPQSNVFSSGPKLYGTVGTGANTFQRPDGFFVIVNGNTTTVTNILDPFTLSVTEGPRTLQNIGGGALNIRRFDGRILLINGAGIAVANATEMYDPSSNAFTIGPPGIVGTFNTGTTAVQLSSGKFWIKASTTTSNIYDPATGLFYQGHTAVGTILAGAVVIPRPDGKFVYMSGAGLSTVIDGSAISAGQTGQALPCTIATGSNVFQRPTGEFVVLCGASANTFIVDAGWNLGGTYTSEQMYMPNLSSQTGMYWKNNSGQGEIFVRYRTAATLQALGMASWKLLPSNGSLLNITPGDTWFQTRIDLQGNLQDLPGAKTRVWLSESSGGAVSYYRQVQAPILQYWKLMNAVDPNILTLTSNGANVFRFTADGQAFTGEDGAWNTGGADLAERYSSTQGLLAGEVVVGDRTKSQNVIRSTDPYQTNIMGVVSTQPGFVAGAYTKDSYPIALVGRVPVKISTENGPVRSGDYLTSASIPGYAMKATVAGRVLGTALEDFSGEAQILCPKEGAGSLTATKCGTVMAFINLTNYNGEKVEMLMADKGFTAPDTSGGIKTESGLDSYMNTIAPKDYQVLSFLQDLKAQGGVEANSAMLTGTLTAVNSVISPEIIAGIITAKTIRADRIEGLEIFTDKLASLSAEMAVLSASTNSGQLVSSPSEALNVGSLNINGLTTISGDVNAKGNGLIEGLLTVLKSITTPNLLVSDFASFFGDVLFKGNTKFEGRPTFNNDTAGFAVIVKGETSVTINFDNDYADMPVIAANIVVAKGKDEASDTKLENQVLSGNISYVITQRTTKGFVIKLNKPLDQDVSFSWVALSVANAKTHSSNSALNITVTPVPSSTQSAAFKSVMEQLSN